MITIGIIIACVVGFILYRSERGPKPMQKATKVNSTSNKAAWEKTQQTMAPWSDRMKASVLPATAPVEPDTPTIVTNRQREVDPGAGKGSL
jgi:hypothetical protein